MHEHLNQIREQMDAQKQLDTLMTPEHKKPRVKAVRLDEHEKWEIAKYLIESKLAMIDKEGRFTRFRNFIKDIVEEINTLEIIGPKKITGEYHLKDSLDFYHRVNAIVGNNIKVPVQDSVQEEMLKIELNKALSRNDKLAKKVDALEQMYAKAISVLETNTKQMYTLYKNEFGSGNASSQKR